MGKSVLIIDDDVGIMRTFARILERNGYRADVAHSGSEALQKMGLKHYDVALVDFCLADTNGLDFLEKLRERDSGTARIVITSSIVSVPNGAELADEYLLKPVKPQELLAIIEQKTKGMHR
jgi:DNA-binding response OmpR family regulator